MNTPSTEIEALPFEIEKWLITIKAHCTVIAEPAPGDDVKELAACIKINVDHDLRPLLLTLSARNREQDTRIAELEAALKEARGKALEEAAQTMRKRWHEIAPAFNKRDPGLERGVAEILEAVHALASTVPPAPVGEKQ